MLICEIHVYFSLNFRFKQKKMAEGLDKEYDVFLVHCTDDRDLAVTIKEGLATRGLNVFAHYDEGTTFNIGMPTVDCINKAVKISKIVLILLTENALKVYIYIQVSLKFKGYKCFLRDDASYFIPSLFGYKMGFFFSKMTTNN